MAASKHLQDHSHQSSLLHRDAAASSSSSSSSSHGPVLPAPAEAMETATTTAANTATSATDDDNNSNKKKAKLHSSVKNPNQKAKKRVRWDRIHTREYTLVVGDHPMCQDGLPVSLGWQYDDHSCSAKHMNAQQSPSPSQQPQSAQNGESSATTTTNNNNPNLLNISERRQSYVFPRRLSYEERRERLISVSNLTSDQIQNDEIDLVVRTLKESWETQYVDGTYICDDVIMSPAPVNDLSCLVEADDFMELDDIEVVPGIEGEELGDITNFEWR